MTPFERGFLKQAAVFGVCHEQAVALYKQARMDGFNPMAPQPIKSITPRPIKSITPPPTKPITRQHTTPMQYNSVGKQSFGTAPMAYGSNPQSHLKGFGQHFSSLSNDDMIRASQAMRAPGVGTQDLTGPRMSDVLRSEAWKQPGEAPISSSPQSAPISSSPQSAPISSSPQSAPISMSPQELYHRASAMVPRKEYNRRDPQYNTYEAAMQRAKDFWARQREVEKMEQMLLREQNVMARGGQFEPQPVEQPTDMTNVPEQYRWEEPTDMTNVPEQYRWEEPAVKIPKSV